MTLTLNGRGLPGGSLLEVSGAIPLNFSVSSAKRYQVTVSGGANEPQTCVLAFRGLRKGVSSQVVQRVLTFANPGNSPVYQGAVSKVGENATHVKYEITAVNVAGIPIVSASIRTFVSGGMGGIYRNESVTLPQVPVGSSASTTIWISKGAALVPTRELIFTGESATSLSPVRGPLTSINLTQACSYSEQVASFEL